MSKELDAGNYLLECQSFIDTLDRLKGTEYFAGDIKILVNQLLNKIQTKYKKQLIAMFGSENAQVTINLLKDRDKFNELAIHEKQLIVQMCEYYKNNPEYWQKNLILNYDILNI